jgi:hypothetical protein
MPNGPLIKFATVRSDETHVGQLPLLLDRYRQKYAKRALRSFTNEKKFFGLQGLPCRQLYPLLAIKVCGDIVVHRDIEPPGDAGPLHALTAARGQPTSQMYHSWWTLVDRQELPGDEFEFHVSVGWDFNREWNEGHWFAGFDIGSASPAFLNKAYRAELIRRIVDAMGISAAIQVTLSDDKLVVSAAPPWKLCYMQAEMFGVNPLGIRFCGFTSYEQALAAARQVMRQVATQVLNGYFSFKCDESVFESLREPLNAIAGDWWARPWGALTSQTLEIISGQEADFGTIPRIPALQWRESVKKVVHVFQLDVTPAGKGCRLELVSDCLDVERLLDRSRICPELEFEVVPD